MTSANFTRNPDRSATVCGRRPTVGWQERHQGERRSQTSAGHGFGQELLQAWQFVDNHTVLVKVRGPKKPNVTLVDLPGFHSG